MQLALPDEVAKEEDRELFLGSRKLFCFFCLTSERTCKNSHFAAIASKKLQWSRSCQQLVPAVTSSSKILLLIRKASHQHWKVNTVQWAEKLLPTTLKCEQVQGQSSEDNKRILRVRTNHKPRKDLQRVSCNLFGGHFCRLTTRHDHLDLEKACLKFDTSESEFLKNRLQYF